MMRVNNTNHFAYRATFMLLIIHVSIFHQRDTHGSSFQGLVQATEEFNTQTMDQVRNRIEELMNIPVEQCRRFIQYRNVRGFQNGMTNDDIATIRTLLYTETSTAIVSGIPAVLYLGLEDGTFIYVNDNLVSGGYREPGNDGYNATDAINDPTNPYHKHINTCVDVMNGTSVPCILQPHDLYIHCINDCEYIPCSNNRSEEEDTSTNQMSTTNSTSTTYCKNYEVREVEENSDESLGYVPITSTCYNQFGQPEQRPGYALMDYFTTSPTFGTCYYGDGTTIVNRTISGNYAACPAQPQQREDNNNNNNTCNTAFTGGHSSYNYDARYRDWYISTKQYQKDMWTAPYAFIGTEIVIGITYSEPLYSIVEYEPKLSSSKGRQNTDKQYFQGVVAVDYNLNAICTFLIDSFVDSDMKIVIVEQEFPYYVVASSVRGGSVSKMILQTATGENKEPILCPANTTNPDCIPERVTIKDFQTGMGDDSLVLYRAFAAQRQQNFPERQQVSFKIRDTMGSPAYASLLQPYSKSNNLNWYIIVVLPMEQSSTDVALPGDPFFDVILVMGSLGFFGCLVMLATFYSKRNEPAVIQADWKFTYAFIAGCAALNLSTFTLVGMNTNPTCMLRMWSFNGLFVCALSTLVVKVWRMAKLLTAPSGFQRQQLSNVQAFLLTLPLIAIEIILLTIFSIADPPQQTESLGVGDGIGLQQVTCSHNTNAFFITQIIFDAILVFIGCFLAYRTRNLDPKFGEAKQIGFSMCNIAFTGIIILGIMYLVELDEVTQITIQAVGVFWGSFVCSCAFVLPMLCEKHVYKNPSSINQSGGNNNNSNRNNGAPNTPARTSRRENSALDSKIPAPSPLEQPLSIETTEADRHSQFSKMMDFDSDPKDSSRNRNGIVSLMPFPFTTCETTIEPANSSILDLNNMDTPSFLETTRIPSWDTSSANSDTVGEASGEVVHPTN